MIPMRINVKHGDSVYRRLNLHLLGIPRRDNRTNRNEAVFRKITEKNVFQCRPVPLPKTQEYMLYL